VFLKLRELRNKWQGENWIEAVGPARRLLSTKAVLQSAVMANNDMSEHGGEHEA
jgi:hypothetical protein